VEDSLTREVNKISSTATYSSLYSPLGSSASYPSSSSLSAAPASSSLAPTPLNGSCIRPITTGVLEVKNKYYGIRKNIDSYVETTAAAPPTDSSTKSMNKHRPRAPLVSRVHPHHPHETSTASAADVSADSASSQLKPKRNDRNKSKQIKRNKKSKSIDVLWQSLQHFSKNNLGRSLADTDVSTSQGVHFVNLSHDEDWEENTATASPLKPSRNKGDSPGQRIFSLPREPVEKLTRNSAAPQLTSVPSTSFTIPELPSGNLLTINILSTWGDPHYVGLVGIEIFDKSGHLVRLTNVENQIWANPADINILSEYGALPPPPLLYRLDLRPSLSLSLSLSLCPLFRL
jgi:hypothetical protein